MMPRRRKKSSDQKPPLEFEESPIHIVKNVQSPVFCSDNPVTADLIPVDACVHIPWVSPQFKNKLSPCLRSRRKRLCSGKNARSKRKCLADQQLSSARKQGKNLRKITAPLKFIGDKESNEDNSCSDENVSGDENYTRIVKRGRAGNRLEIIYSQDEMPVHVPSAQCTDIEESKIHQLDETASVVPNRDSSKSGPNTPCDSFNTPPYALNGILTPNIDVQNNSDKKTPRPRADKDVQISLNSTHMRPVTPSRNKARIKLFHGTDCRTGDIKSDASNCTSPVSKPSHTYSSITEDTQPANSPSRLKVKSCHHIFSNVLHKTPQRPTGHDSLQILAYDTPEEDYGLTVRQRIIKKIKSRKSKR